MLNDLLSGMLREDCAVRGPSPDRGSLLRSWGSSFLSSKWHGVRRVINRLNYLPLEKCMLRMLRKNIYLGVRPLSGHLCQGEETVRISLLVLSRAL